MIYKAIKLKYCLDKVRHGGAVETGGVDPASELTFKKKLDPDPILGKLLEPKPTVEGF